MTHTSDPRPGDSVHAFSEDTIKVHVIHEGKATMGRPPGSKNRSPRELQAEAKHRMKEAKLKLRLEAKQRQIDSMKAKKAAAKAAKKAK
ncbi:hypothetical protein GCM10025780_24170 [Frondihabitans cladoniiphilus]|uniref:Uncharacterized protein n=1 Tax=Frondihabitans cladoniiphilus TaxID=715785 RepID=A0ABP8W323_9MICO